MQKKFWEFRNQGSGKAELFLYGDIAGEQSWFGDEVTPKQFAKELNALGNAEEITVHITSAGGDVFAAQAIGNLLEQHPAKVTARIDGICASAATIVACHCDKVIAANDSTYMVHPVRMYMGFADADELQKGVEALAAIRENIVNLYAKKTGRTAEEAAAWMDATSWWTGSQAKENGFVDELADEETETVVENRGGTLFVNCVDMNLPFDRTPVFLQNRLAAARSAAGEASAGLSVEPKQEGKSMEIKTTDELRSQYPELVNQIEEAAAQQKEIEERQRIRDIEDMALPGSEELTAKAKFDEPMSASDYAKALVKHAKTQGAAFLDQLRQEADEGGANGVGGAPTPEDKDSAASAIAQAKADAAVFLGKKKGGQ